MVTASLHNRFLRSVILCSIVLSSACGGNENQIKNSNGVKLENISLIKDNIELFADTVTVQTTEELISHIKSNRLILLDSGRHELKSTLEIDNINSLKIVGISPSELKLHDKGATTIHLLNSNNIHLDGLIIEHSGNKGYEGAQGTLRVSQSENIIVSNCKIFGPGTFGFATYEVNNLTFSNSEITECTGLIFELSKSRNFTFMDSKFYNNDLGTSVLGGFTNSTKDITFTNCAFLNNKPDMTGNPAFNFMDNWENFDEPIIFKNCIFKNNKGYKWYGDKIKLINCKIDSTDFIGMQENK